MNIKDLKHKQVAILGYGQEGKAVVKYLMKHGVKPVLFDQKPWKKWPKEEQRKIQNLGLKHHFGPNCFKRLAEFDVVFRSPGIPLSRITPRLRPFGFELRAERSGSPPVTSQAKWFFENCPAKIIGVTGTKGKSTTAALIYEILKQGKSEILNSKSEINPKSKILNLKSNVYLTGNIGQVQPFDILDDLKTEDWVVYELSSFQLQDLKISPHIAVILMTTSEHLDYHKNTKEYQQAKQAICKFQQPGDFAVINIDSPASRKIGRLGKGTKIYFSRKKTLQQGCFVDDDKIIIKNIGKSNFQFPLLRPPRADFGGQATSPSTGSGSRAESRDNLQLKGGHNLENVCAAIVTAGLTGCRPTTIAKTVEKFKGLEHRLEFVEAKKGVKFYDDSISTIPETAMAALQSFSEPIILILGGSSKKSDFTKLGKAIIKTKNIKSIILIGQETQRIKNAIFKAGAFRGRLFEGAKSMATVFLQIAEVAEKGDTVLLSPACASFDMFKNYQDRGEQFKKQVKAL